MLTNKQFAQLQEEIHAENVAKGWWDNERSIATFSNLFHSELSEAMEGDRKGLMDDHLPQYEMYWVELGDFVIRVLDYLGDAEWDWVDGGFYASPPTICHRDVAIAVLHSKVSKFYKEFDLKSLAVAVKLCFRHAYFKKVDLLSIINEKRLYNSTRKDHTRDARAAEGGKRY